MITPLELKCEYARDPLGIDTRHPRLSWYLYHPRRGQSQTAFQILAATSPDLLSEESADLWNTGKVRSPHSMAGYAGFPLASRARCYWTVRAWDAQDQPGPFSPPAWFEMGLLQPGAQPLLDRQALPAVEPTCDFSCSSDLLNHLYQMTQWPQNSALPTGYTQGGEHLGWLNHLAARVEAGLYTGDLTRLLTRWTAEVASAQDPASGAVAGPSGVAYLLAPWQCFMLRGDTRAMAEHYPGLKAWVEFLTVQAHEHLLNANHSGDWVPPIAESCGGAFVASAFYYYLVLLLYEISGVLGKSTDKAFYAKRFDQIDAAFNRRFWDEAAGGYGDNSLACNALALYLELVPAARKARVVANLLRGVLEQSPGRRITSSLGVKYLLEALTRAGRADVAYRLVMQMMELSGSKMDAPDHPLQGAGAWIIKTIGGIAADSDPDYPAFERFSVSPYTGGGLTWSNLSLKTVRGPVQAFWQIGPEEAFHLAVNIPVGSTALVYLPQPPAGTAAELSEGGVKFWEDGRTLFLPEGVRAVHAAAHSLIVTTGSGIYTFTRA